MSICNFRCSYCYLAQRPVHYQGIQPEMKYTPAEVANALTVERVGGPAFMNFCADGETLLTTNIDLYVKALVEQGHYAEVVTNLTITPVLKKFLSWDKELLKRLEFKCSFHYLELKKKGLLDTFANNVRMIWEAGASANIEMMPSDDLIPYIEEVKEFSMKHFGALPQLSIVRNDRTSGIDYLTSLPMEKYNNTWGQFHSDFWEFKKSIFGVKQTKFCYAGAWSLYINLCDGTATQCYCGVSLGDVFAHPYKPIPSKPIGKCPIAHCYNGHAFMTLGLIPGYTINYGNIRNRVKEDGNQWLQPELLSFFNSKLEDSNAIYPPLKQLAYLSKERLTHVVWRGASFVKRCVRKIIQ
jgi:hypothetical protein